MRNITSRAGYYNSTAESFSEVVNTLKDPSAYQEKLKELSRIAEDVRVENERLAKGRSLEFWESDLNTKQAALNAAQEAHQNKVLQETQALEKLKTTTQLRCQNEVEEAIAKAKQIVEEANVSVKKALEAQRIEEERRINALTVKYQEATKIADKALGLLQQIEGLNLGAVRNVLSSIVAAAENGANGVNG